MSVSGDGKAGANDPSQGETYIHMAVSFARAIVLRIKIEMKGSEAGS